ncbi:MAG: 2-dehydropantoate 2-reductase [Spirochaetes bacterium]|nr:2-dehydropantoate 2-reductase [Spirochaetota bacterium]
MRILIYGAGAVGLGIASCLYKDGQKPDILTRPETCKALKSKGLIRSGIFGDFKVLPKKLSVYSSMDEIPDNKKYDHILVSVKSYDSKTTADDILKNNNKLDKTCKIILFQNGSGNAEIFGEKFSKSMIYNARVITGFIRPQLNHVNITVHADAIHMGSLFKKSIAEIEPVCRAISNGDIPCIAVEDINRDIWAKMLYNCSLNPLGAIFRVPYGILGEHIESRQIMNAVIDEIFWVLKRCKYKTHWQTADEYKEIFYNKLIKLTKDHESSMLQDLRSGRKTEIDALNGEILRLGNKYNLSVPVNTTIYNMIKFFQKQ